jgi:hypothetical protein
MCGLTRSRLLSRQQTDRKSLSSSFNACLAPLTISPPQGGMEAFGRARPSPATSDNDRKRLYHDSPPPHRWPLNHLGEIREELVLSKTPEPNVPHRHYQTKKLASTAHKLIEVVGAKLVTSTPSDFVVFYRVWGCMCPTNLVWGTQACKQTSTDLACGQGGSTRQRLAASDALESSAPEGQQSDDPFSGNHLLITWLYDWSWGILYASHLVRYARAAIRSNFTNELMLRVSRFSDANAHVQLQTLFCKNVLGVPVDTLDGGIVKHIIYPHKLFAALFEHFPTKCDTFLGARTESVLTFWEQFLKTPVGIEMSCRLPALRGRTPADLKHCIPLVGHSSLLQNADLRHVLMNGEGCSGKEDMKHVWRWQGVWSLDAGSHAWRSTEPTCCVGW